MIYFGASPKRAAAFRRSSRGNNNGGGRSHGSNRDLIVLLICMIIGLIFMLLVTYGALTKMTPSVSTQTKGAREQVYASLNHFKRKDPVVLPTKPVSRPQSGNVVNPLHMHEPERKNEISTLELHNHQLPSIKDFATASKPVIAYAISLTSCGDDASLTDGAAVLKHSIHLAHDAMPKYGYKMYAIVHPEAMSCAPQMIRAGYTILERDVPVAVRDIQGDFLRTKVVENGCCGEKEFIKLHAYTLTNHSVVVHLDLDTLILQPMQELYDAMIESPLTAVAKRALFDTVVYRQDKVEGRPVFVQKTPSMSSVQRIDAYFTRDYNMHPPKRKYGLVQGGFLILRPSMDTYEAFCEIIRKGDFRDGSGWGGQGHKGYGAMTFQGIIPYYYDLIQPNTHVELNRCIYNQMSDNPRDQKTIDNVVHGNCRDGRDDCEDCRSVDISVVKTAHFTLCQKPWICKSMSTDRIQDRLCRKLHHAWFHVRHDLEGNVTGTGSFDAEHFYGYCSRAGSQGYIPVKLAA